MNCQIVPDRLLKELGDKKSLKLSKDLRGQRNKVLRYFKSFRKKAVEENVHALRYTYDCLNKAKLPGVLAQTEDQNDLFVSIQIYDAHRYARVVREFYNQVLGRHSWDGSGHDLISSCHYDENYNNAFFNGEQMAYGDGDNKLFVYFSRDLSVIGHEFSHGVVQETAGLVYYYQSGAANESYADKFGIAVKHWFYGQSDPRIANWLIGDEIVGPEFPGKAIRSFKNEKAHQWDHSPKHMKDYRWLAPFEDNGGVHINSGILNHAFYKLCMKLNEPSYGKPIQIAYEGLLKLNQFSQFKDIAKAEHKASQELYGIDSYESKTVREAYREVGIKI